MEHILIALAAFVAGILGSALGFGGGLILIPLLTLAFKVPIHLAVGTMLLAMIPAALAALVIYFREGLVLVKLALLAAVLAAGGAIFGASVVGRIAAPSLKVAFGSVVMLLALLMLRRGSGKNSNHHRARGFFSIIPPRFKLWLPQEGGEAREVAFSLPLLILSCLAVGLFSGMFGLGGGFLLTPLLILVFDIPIRSAVATALVTIVIAAATGSAIHATGARIDLTLAAVIGGGLFIGALIGPRIALKLPERLLQAALGVVLLGLGLIMILKVLI